MQRIACIVNPAAGGGKSYKRLQPFLSAFRRHGIPYEVHRTGHPDHGTELTRQAIQAGATTVIAVGGDGTVNEVVNGFFHNGKLHREEVALAVLSAGTASDFARSLSLPESAERLSRQIQEQRIVHIDVGLIEYTSHSGNLETRYFLNVADAGYGGALLQRWNRVKKFVPGPPAYFVGLLLNLLFYDNLPVQYRLDGGDVVRQHLNALIVANAQYFGGGMWIAPEARPDDGWFDVIVLGDVNKMEIMANLRRLYNGTLCEYPKVQCMRARRIEAWSEATVFLECDGELIGKLPCTFEMLPAALPLHAL